MPDSQNMTKPPLAAPDPTAQFDRLSDLLKRAQQLIESARLLGSGSDDEEHPATLIGEALSLTGRLSAESVMLRKENHAFRKVMRDTNELLEEKIEEISLIRLVADATNDAIFAQDPLRFILENVIRIIGAENGSILLLERETNQLVLRAASGSRDGRPHDVRFALGEGIAGWVAQCGKAAFINETNKDERFKPRGDRSLGSLICQPLIVEKEVIGVLNVSHSDPNAFTNNTARLLYIIAGQAATAIRNAQLLTEAKRHGDVLREAEERLTDLFEAANDAMFSVDAETGSILRANAQAHEYTGFSRSELSALRLDNLFSEEHAKEIRDLSRRRKSKTVDGIPLRRIDGHARFMEIKTWRSRFGEREVINIVCRDTSEREQVRQELADLVSQRDFLVRVGSLMERGGSNEELLDMLIAESGARFATLQFLSGKSLRQDEFIVVGRGPEDLVWLSNGAARLVREDSPWSRALIKNHAQGVESLQRFPGSPHWIGWLRKAGIESLVCVPFVRDGLQRGVLTLYHPEAREFSAVHLSFFDDLVRRLVQAGDGLLMCSDRPAVAASL